MKSKFSHSKLMAKQVVNGLRMPSSTFKSLGKSKPTTARSRASQIPVRTKVKKGIENWTGWI